MLGFISPATLFYHSIPLRDPALIVQLLSLIAYSLRLLIESIHLHSLCFLRTKALIVYDLWRTLLQHYSCILCKVLLLLIFSMLNAVNLISGIYA